jgi:4-amino-4-deoxy-L-arabinose transferase-like glycosyltransferase
MRTWGERAQQMQVGTLAVLGAALVYSVLNALKPLRVDDPFTWYVSRQILKAPLDPYGFEIFWLQWPQPVAEDLLAPVVAYWGALALKLAGSNDFLWKLSLLPFAVLFALSFHRLARRFAPGLETPLTLLTLFSPVFLPSMNFMQDVPALAVGLAALALYLRAEERGSFWGAAAAGLVAGLAMQTKYTAFSIPAAMGLHALIRGRPLYAVAAGVTALVTFSSWEAWITHLYGRGMFAANAALPLFWAPRLMLVFPGIQLLGAALTAFALLALAALRVPRAIVLGLGAVILAAHGLLLAWPVEQHLHLATGLLALASLVVVSVARVRAGRSAPPPRGRRRLFGSADLFLVGWVLLEVTSFFEISYFAAVRRVLPLAVPATLLLGRAAALAAPGLRLPLVPIAALQVLLGFAHWGIDFLEGRAERDVARDAYREIRARQADGDVWFTGHWGFQYYAEQLGMRPLVPDYSEVRAGDWVVVPTRVHKQEVALDPAVFQLAAVVIEPRGVPLWTTLGFYSGGTPLQHGQRARMAARLYRARAASVPPSAWTLEQASDWAMRAGGRQAGWATRSLMRELERNAAAEGRLLAARALRVLGPLAAEALPALERAAAGDPDPAVRLAAQRTLTRLRASLDRKLPPPSPEGPTP